MNEKTKWIVRIGVTVAVVCLVALVILKACGKSDEDYAAVTDEPPVVSTSVKPSDVIVEPSDAMTEPSPEESKEPVIDSDYVEEEYDYSNQEVIESAANLTFKSNYDNSQVVRYEYGTRGEYIDFGLGSSEITDAFYINPVHSNTSEDRFVGFYFSSDIGMVECSSAGASNTPSFKRIENYNVALTRTYDYAQLAMYTDEDYSGMRWTASTFHTATIYVRAIDLSETNYGILLTTCRIELVFDDATEKFVINRIYNSDVKNTEELSKQERDFVVEDAIAYLRDTSRCKRAISFTSGRWEDETVWQTIASNATVELVPAPYFTVFWSAKGEGMMAYEVSSCDVYAVSLPVPGFGFITVYFAPEKQLIGLSGAYYTNDTSLHLTVFGYDAFLPFTDVTIDKILIED